MTRIVVHIDKLVLTGIDRHDAAAVSAGVQAELQRLLAQPGAVASLVAGGDRARFHTAVGPVAQGAVGQGVGRAIAGGIVPGSKP